MKLKVAIKGEIIYTLQFFHQIFYHETSLQKIIQQYLKKKKKKVNKMNVV